jgi:hypothetical protein
VRREITMPVDTRSTQYSTPAPSQYADDDTNMDESSPSLALPAPSTHNLPTNTAVTVLEHAEQMALTTIPPYSPPTDLENLLASIPAPVHIQHVHFSVQ